MDAREADYAHFVRTRTHALLRSAYLLTGDQHLAEDLVQETLARTHRAWQRLDRTENAEAYARTVPAVGHGDPEHLPHPRAHGPNRSAAPARAGREARETGPHRETAFPHAR